MSETKPILESNSPDLKSLCICAFDSLISYYNKEHKWEFPSKFKSLEFPLFVTWSTGKSKDLRGCIGTFQSSELETQLPEYALFSALKDSRFKPISPKEILSLNVSVSLLINFEKGKDAMDWEVGKHGIRIQFGFYRATFLPHVATEQGWDKITTLKYLIRKAGCFDDLEDVIDKIELTRYQSIVAEVTYEEYKKEKGNC
jgi:uncharacterized protein (TIGR00296 family)